MQKLSPNAIPFTPAISSAIITEGPPPFLPHHPPPPIFLQTYFFYPFPYNISRPANPCAYNFGCYIPAAVPCPSLAAAAERRNLMSLPETITAKEEKVTPMLSASSGSVARGPRVRGGRHRVSPSSPERFCSRVFWIPKSSSAQKKQLSAAAAACVPPDDFGRSLSAGDEPAGDELNSGDGGSWKTTVMLKNIPNKFSKQQLLEFLDEHCRKENAKENSEAAADSTRSEFDFFYLPMDFQSGSNLGYAFVNFTSVAAARRLHRELHHKPWNAYGSRKVCEVTQAKIQGSEGLLKHFKASIFTCSSETYLPVFFNPSRDGFRHTKERLVGKLAYHASQC